jgi:NADPH-dependent curcumin reductase CurA
MTNCLMTNHPRHELDSIQQQRKMAPVENKTVVFNKIPEGEPTKGTFQIQTSPFNVDEVAKDLRQDEVIVALNVFSLDPYLRTK